MTEIKELLAAIETVKRLKDVLARQERAIFQIETELTRVLSRLDHIEAAARP